MNDLYIHRTELFISLSYAQYCLMFIQTIQIAGKRSGSLDQEAQQWIEAVIGEKFPSGSYDDALKDGILLCKYASFVSVN